MGFSLKSWASHALKVPKSLRKINVGKTIRRAAQDAIGNFEAGVRSAGQTVGSLPETAANVNDAAKTVKLLPWLLLGGAVVLGVILWKRGR